MAKTKKAETKESKESKTLETFMAEVEAHNVLLAITLDNFRASFKNLENQLALLKERNRLR